MTIRTFSVGLAVTIAVLLISAVLLSVYTHEINQRLMAEIQAEQDARGWPRSMTIWPWTA